jgi:hypothetical protein
MPSPAAAAAPGTAESLVQLVCVNPGRGSDGDYRDGDDRRRLMSA